MSKLTRKRTVLAKIESVYGTDPTPSSTDAILLKNLTVTPLDSTLVSRDLIRPYLGNSEQLMAQKFSKIDFEVEMAGPGTIGKIPAYDCLLRSCAMVGAATNVTITAAIASSVVTVTSTAHGLITGDKIITSGFTDTNCNKSTGVTITKTGNDTFTFPAAGAADDATADGTPVYRSAYVYSPVSASFESSTIYFNVDGILHKLTGCMGTVAIDLKVKEIPVFKFSLTGLYNAPTDTAAPSTDFSGFQIPQVANSQNTLTFSLASYSALLESMTLDIANQVQYITLIGSETVKILDRKPAGVFLFEAPTLASKDFFTLASAQTSSVMTLTHGSSNGYKVKIDAPAVLIGNPNYQDSNGVQMINVPYTANPSSTSGNDEFTIAVK